MTSKRNVKESKKLVANSSPKDGLQPCTCVAHPSPFPSSLFLQCSQPNPRKLTLLRLTYTICINTPQPSPPPPLNSRPSLSPFLPFCQPSIIHLSCVVVPLPRLQFSPPSPLREATKLYGGDTQKSPTFPTFLRRRSLPISSPSPGAILRLHSLPMHIRFPDVQ